METFVLDTSVLVADPNVLQTNNAILIIPNVAIKEIDGHKNRNDEVGRNARYISRFLDGLREQGSLTEGINFNGSIIKVEPCGDAIDGNDLKIVQCAKENNAILLSKDINVRLAADSIGVTSRDYKETDADIDEIYKGWREIKVSPERIDKFYTECKLSTRIKDIQPNEFVIVKDDCGYNKSAIGRYDCVSNAIVPLRYSKTVLFGDIEALNVEQKFAFELLLDDNIQLVSFIGRAGTGKTLISLAAGLEQIIDDNKFKRLIVCRAIVPVGGKDLGALPGDFDEKMAPWSDSIWDSLGLLSENKDIEIADIVGAGKIQVIPLSYLRGRSLRDTWLLIDEAQNISPKEIKTIITRAGEGSKVILTGDIGQIDHPYLDQINNGLTHVVERFKGQKEFGHVLMTHSKRSRLAELASELL